MVKFEAFDAQSNVTHFSLCERVWLFNRRTHNKDDHMELPNDRYHPNLVDYFYLFAVEYAFD